MTVKDVALAHRAEATKLTGAAYRRAMRDWKRVDPNRIVVTWQEALPGVAAAFALAQRHAAIDAQAATLAELDGQDLDYDGPLIDPGAFSGTMQETGAAVDAALAGVAFHTLDRISDGVDPVRSMRAGGIELGRLANVAVMDAARGMSSAFAATRPAVSLGYRRLAQPGCCVRCSLLVGRFYRWNAGFDRHTNCRCVHVATTESSDEELLDNPYELFEALSPSEQDRIWTKAGAQALRDGADIYQVGNTIQKRRSDGMRRSGSRRFESTTRRGYFRRGTEAGQAGRRRLSVSEIYRRAGGSREAAQELMRQHGYITGVGQVTGGAIIGDFEGFGQFGRGGARRGARAAVLEAQRTGRRDPRSRYTMTAAELRAFYAAQRAA